MTFFSQNLLSVLKDKIAFYEYQHGEVAYNDGTVVMTGCTAGCAGDCQGDCRASCQNSCFNSCSGSFSK